MHWVSLPHVLVQHIPKGLEPLTRIKDSKFLFPKMRNAIKSSLRLHLMSHNDEY